MLRFQWKRSAEQETYVNELSQKTDRSIRNCKIKPIGTIEARCGHVTICKIRLWYAIRSFPRHFSAHGSEMRAYTETRKRKTNYIIMKESKQNQSCMPMGENG